MKVDQNRLIMLKSYSTNKPYTDVTKLGVAASLKSTAIFNATRIKNSQYIGPTAV
jgi:hypothetical protein